MKKDTFASGLRGDLSISTYNIKKMVDDFHGEMRRGLAGEKSSLKMLPSFALRPKGTEKGKYLALDLGGTNLRVLAVELDGKGKCSIVASDKLTIGSDLMVGDGEALFDLIAGSVKGFLAKAGIGAGDDIPLGFTFSFPVEQTAAAEGRLIHWTKGFTASGVEGKDVIALMRAALARIGAGHVKIAALVNDTVGTLAAKSYTDTSCDMGVILGTGTNACYPEKISNITKNKNIGTTGEMIVNMEWGNFSKLTQTSYDIELDKDSENPGAQYFEKMVSGMYLGEIVRRVICKAAAAGLLFKGIEGGRYMEKDAFKTEHMSALAGGDHSILDGLGLGAATNDDKNELVDICEMVSTRSARLSGAAIAAVVSWIDPKLEAQHTIGIDGSLFEKYPGYKDKMEEVFHELFGKQVPNIKLEMAKDGSGVGAAIIAATVSNIGS